MCVNNLPKVVTRQLDSESNQRPRDHQSDTPLLYTTKLHCLILRLFVWQWKTCYHHSVMKKVNKIL